MANFLDLTTGLPALWAKIKSKFYTKAEVDAAIPSASSTSPEMDGTVAVGVSTAYARADHVHPTDTSRVAVAQGTEYAGRVLTVGSDGNVSLERKPDFDSLQIAYGKYTSGALTSIYVPLDVTFTYIGDTVSSSYFIFYAPKDITNVSRANLYPFNGITSKDVITSIICYQNNNMTNTAPAGLYYARTRDGVLHLYKYATSTEINENYLSKTNTTSYTPTADYNPATKKYVDDTVAAAAPTCATTAEIEEMCDALEFRSETINTDAYVTNEE